MSSPHPRRSAGLLLLLGVVSGCASLVKEPGVTLSSVGLHSVGLTGAAVRVQLRVSNPNRFSLDARAMEYTLSFGEETGAATGTEAPDSAWMPVAAGRTAEGIVLAAGDTTPVTVDVPFTYRDVGKAVARLLQDGRLNYRFHGSFTVGSPVGELRIPFDRTGLLDP